MKSKIILLIAGVAAVTLSFTFATNSPMAEKDAKLSNEKQTHSEPAGGFFSEDKL